MASTAGNRRHIGARPGGVGERFRLARARSAPEPLAIGHVSRETCGTVRVRDPGLMELVRGLLPWETRFDGSANLHKVVMIAPAGESSWSSVPAPKSHRFGSAWAAWTRRRPQMVVGSADVSRETYTPPITGTAHKGSKLPTRWRAREVHLPALGESSRASPYGR